MSSLTYLYLGVLLPFLLVFLIAALIFCIVGYKKGFLRALISLGATAVSAVVSFFLAKLLTPAALSYVPTDSISSAASAFPSTVVYVVDSIVPTVLWLVLFSFVMFVVTFILKLVFGAIGRRLRTPLKASSKIGGMSVRLFDAFIYTVLILLPIYGTMHAYSLFDLSEIMVRHHLDEQLQKEEIDAAALYESGCLEEIFTVFNGNDRLYEMKSWVILDAIPLMLESEPEKIDAFLDTLEVKRLTTADEIKREAGAVGVLLSSQEYTAFLEVIIRHPIFTDASLELILEDHTFAGLMDIEGSLAIYIDSYTVSEQLRAKLFECAESEFSGNCFADYCSAIIATDAIHAAADFKPEDCKLSVGDVTVAFAHELLAPYLQEGN